MSDEFASPLLDDDGKLRMRRFAIATVASAVVLAAVVALLMHLADPDAGWGVAIGVGAMIGFWMSPLPGSLIGNGFHEINKHRQHMLDEAPAAEHDSQERIAA